MSFEIIKLNFDRRLWNKEMVKIAVEKGIITEKQFSQITGEEYKG